MPMPEREERGSASLEMALLAPVLLLVIFGGIQAAAVFLGQAAAEDAAQAGAHAAARYKAGSADGFQEAQARADKAGRPWLENPSVQITHNGTWATVTVSGESVSLLPGLNLHFSISKTATVPVERLT